MATPTEDPIERFVRERGRGLSFERPRGRREWVRGVKEAGWKLIDATRLISITANLGDPKSTITHPASTTHNRLTPQQREQAGIADGLIRIAVGLEDIEDLKKDLSRGLV